MNVAVTVIKILSTKDNHSAAHMTKQGVGQNECFFISRWIALKFCVQGFQTQRIKRYLHVNTNVEISFLNWNNLGVINFIKDLTAKSNSMGQKSLWTKFQFPLIKMRENIHFSDITWCRKVVIFDAEYF